jgi:hypothetical protein
MDTKRLLPFILVFVATIISFIVMVNVLMGLTGSQENWRVAASIAGFASFLLFNFVITFQLGRLKGRANFVKKNRQ